MRKRGGRRAAVSGRDGFAACPPSESAGLCCSPGRGRSSAERGAAPLCGRADSALRAEGLPGACGGGPPARPRAPSASSASHAIPSSASGRSPSVSWAVTENGVSALTLPWKTRALLMWTRAVATLIGAPSRSRFRSPGGLRTGVWSSSGMLAPDPSPLRSARRRARGRVDVHLWARPTRAGSSLARPRQPGFQIARDLSSDDEQRRPAQTDPNIGDGRTGRRAPPSRAASEHGLGGRGRAKRGTAGTFCILYLVSADGVDPSSETGSYRRRMRMTPCPAIGGVGSGRQREDQPLDCGQRVRDAALGAVVKGRSKTSSSM